MKKFITLLKPFSGLGMLLIMLLCAIFGVADSSVMMAESAAVSSNTVIAEPVNAGTNVTDAHVSSADLMLDTIDDHVCKVRPHDVVLDTISRHATSKKSNNQIVRPYSVDALELFTYTNGAWTLANDATTQQVVLDLDDNDLISRDETLIAEGVNGFKADGTADTKNNLMLYVVDKDSTGKPIVRALNGKTVGTTKNVIPTIADNTKILRAGRAGAETQMQTDAYSGYPTDTEQYLQKFMCQVEESELFKISDKEVKWSFSDTQEEAVYDMRRTMNISFWRGVKTKLKLKNSRSEKLEDIYFTGGIWNQGGKEISAFGTGTGNVPTANDLVTLMKTSFTGNQSGKKKLLIMGSDFLEKLEQIEYTRNINVGERVEAYGLVFNSIVSKFGTLLGVHDQTFDDMGWSKRAFVLDADFLRKYTMGWQIQDLDFKSSGQKDVDGRVIREICGLVLKNPNAHVRVIGAWS